MFDKRCQKKRFLIVDDFSPFRRSLKQMLEGMGATEIKAAATAADALELCDEYKFDVVLCDYNLGEEMDGQELHEELVHRGIITSRTLFLMVTAEDSASMVIASVVCEPDAYLTKPFGSPALRSRLNRGFDTKDALKVIHIAMELGDKGKAIALCDYVRKKSPRYSLQCLKLESNLLMEEERFEQAKTLFQSVNERVPMPWALLGEGKLDFFSEELGAASAAFERAIHFHQHFVPAYDWLAKVKVAQKDYVGAQKILEKAVRISPKNISRQLELARLADGNDDKKAYFRAYRNAVKYARYTRHRNADNYVKLANGICNVLESTTGLKERSMLKEARNCLTQVRQDFRKDEESQVRAGLGQAKLLDKDGQHSSAENQRKDALVRAESMEDFACPDTFIEVAEGYIEEGDEERAAEMLDKLEQSHPAERQLHKKRNKMFGSRNVGQMRELAAEQNEEGVALYKVGEHIKAAKFFMKASDSLPTDPSYALNAVQSLCDIAREEQSAGDVERATKYLDRINLAENDYRTRRYEKLRAQVAELRQELVR